MTLTTVVIQLLNGLTSASSLFLVAAGLSLIFGVTRIVNFAHGSFYMLGAYGAYSLAAKFGSTPAGYWSAVVLAALAVGVLGVVIEALILRRIYAAPELLQLIATFGIVMIVKDATLALWGAEDLLGRRAPGLGGTVEILGRPVPEYDLLLIALGPVVLVALWALLTRTRWGVLVRAATQDREMAGALGVNQALLFSSVFFVGSVLAGLGGALQLPREPANLGMDLNVIAEVFVVVVVGGMGSIPGAFVASLVIGLTKAACIATGDVHVGGHVVAFPKLTLVVEFIVMAIVLVFRPWGLFGRVPGAQRVAGTEEPPLRAPTSRAFFTGAVVLACLLLLPLAGDRYAVVLATDIAIFALFAVSLHLLMGPAGMGSFGHAAYFGLGAYGAALALKQGAPMLGALLAGPVVAALGALVFGWFCVRLAGVYAAMLTLAFAQITWAVAFQWDAVTGGSNGIVGVWPAPWLADKTAFYYFTLAICAGVVLFLWRIVHAPFGYALRAGRDQPLRCDAIGIDAQAYRWGGFVLAGACAGIAGALFAFSKGSISPETLAIPRSVDGLIMVLLGGVQTLTGPVVGAAVFTWLHDSIARQTDFWRALLGVVILALVLVFPQGIVGTVRRAVRRNADFEGTPR
jgi:branched-chain amino acid transport system permease protein